MKNESWVRMPLTVMQDERLTGISAFVYAIMVDRAVEEHVKITAQKIADVLQKQQRAVERAIKQLKDTGYITETKRGQNGSTVYTLKLILPEKKRTSEQAKKTPAPEAVPPAQMSVLEAPPEQVVPPSSVAVAAGTLEADTTPEQRQLLCDMISAKLDPAHADPDRCRRVLQGEYLKAKASSASPIRSVFAYLKKQISAMETEKPAEKPKSSKDIDMGGGLTLADYEKFINDYTYI